MKNYLKKSPKKAVFTKSNKETLKGAISLGTASIFDYILKFIISLILVRMFSVEDYGYYRGFWLVVNTAYAVATLGIPFYSLFYFLPRLNNKSLYIISNVYCFLILSGGISSALYIYFSQFLPSNIKAIPLSLLMFVVFIPLWIVGSLLEILPNAENRINRQAVWITILSIVYFVLISGTALMSKSFYVVVISILIYAVLKNFGLVYEIVKKYGALPIRIKKSLAIQQIQYAFPFGMAGVLYNLREHGDQWIAAIRFNIDQFAIFTIAGVATPIVAMIRQSVSNAVLPKINESHSKGDIDNAIRLNRESNWLTAVVLVPILAYGYFFAEELIEVLYTTKFTDAQSPLKVYIIGYLSYLFITNNLLICLAKGNFMLKVNALCLPISWAGSWVGAIFFGIGGAAIGSAITQWIEKLVGIIYLKNTFKIEFKALIDYKKTIIYAIFICCVAFFVKTILNEFDSIKTIQKLVIAVVPFGLIELIISYRTLKIK